MPQSIVSVFFLKVSVPVGFDSQRLYGAEAWNFHVEDSIQQHGGCGADGNRYHNSD